MRSSRVTHLGASLVLGLMLTAGLASSVYAAAPSDPKPGSDASQPATQVAPAVAYHISGTVTGTGSVPLQNVTVSAESATYSSAVLSAADGTYSISVPAGTYVLNFNPGSALAYVRGYYNSSASGHFTFSYSSATPVTIVSGDATGKDVQLPPGYTISGTVTGPGAVPLAGIRVEAYVPDYDGVSYTSSTGTYSSVVPPSNSYTLRFSDQLGAYLAGYYSSGASGHITTSSGAATLVPVGTSNVTGKDVQMVVAPPWSVTLTASTTHATVGTTAVTLTATASEDVGLTSYWIVILDGHNNAVRYCGGGMTCATQAGWTNTVVGTETYHAVVGHQDGTSPVATSASRSVSWTPGTATHFTVKTANPYVAGSGHTVTVTALDAYGNTATGYLGTIHFTSSDTHAVLPANYTFLGADAGIHAFSGGLILKTPGSQSVTATDKDHASLTGSQTVTVTPGAATHYTVATASSFVAGASHTLTVTALDASGNTATGYTGTVHFTSSDAKAVLPADATLTNGVGTFTVTLRSAGSRSVTATDTAHATITGSRTATVTPGAASHLTVVTANPYVKGASHTLTVTALDAYGNVATGYTGAIHVTSSDPAATLPADYTFIAADKGIHKFTITLRTAGSRSVTATDKAHATITGSQTVSVT